LSEEDESDDAALIADDGRIDGDILVCSVDEDDDDDCLVVSVDDDDDVIVANNDG
jgi:hypothetical protein